MPCYHPIKAWKSRQKNESGKRSIVFDIKYGYSDMPLEIPCNQCIGCKLEYSRQWAVRITHENQMHEQSMFITLTYSDKYLPVDESLHKSHFQKFIKRYRKFLTEPLWNITTGRMNQYTHQKLRYYHCGEYGNKDKTRRPHYHAIIFGHDFGDKILWQEKDGFKLYISENLSSIWGQGFCTIAGVTFESAAYVARYVTKKITGDKSTDHYQHITRFGELVDLLPEYATMSLKPAIGATWFEKFYKDSYPSDTTIINRKTQSNPKFYDVLYERMEAKKLKRVKRRRKNNAKKHLADQTIQRLDVREQCAHAKLNKGKL